MSKFTWAAVTLAACAVLLSGCQAQHNKACFLRAVEVINARELSKLDDLLVPNYVRHCQATPGVEVHNLDDFKRFLKSDFAAVPDSVVTTKWLVAEGNLLAFYCTYEGTQTGQMGPFPPSGRRISLEFSGVHRFEEGKIAESWLTWDNLTGLVQLGHYTPPANDH